MIQKPTIIRDYPDFTEKLKSIVDQQHSSDAVKLKKLRVSKFTIKPISPSKTPEIEPVQEMAAESDRPRHHKSASRVAHKRNMALLQTSTQIEQNNFSRDLLEQVSQ